MVGLAALDPPYTLSDGLPGVIIGPMDSSSQARILILGGPPWWAQCLRQQGDWLVWSAGEERPNDQEPDLLLVEGDAAPLAGGTGVPPVGVSSTGVSPVGSGGTGVSPVFRSGGNPIGTAATDCGVLRIGGSAAADVCLPGDVTARELVLACRLLVQIVRLRHQVRRGAELSSWLTRQAVTDPLTGLPNRRAGRGLCPAAGRYVRLPAAVRGDSRSGSFQADQRRLGARGRRRSAPQGQPGLSRAPAARRLHRPAGRR